MIEFKAPNSYSAFRSKPSVFLAGSIEMGKAVDWQLQVATGLALLDVLILNPRRDNWDNSFEQSIDNPAFREQVEWELDALDTVDLVVFYFDPATKSPITMMELGIHAAQNPRKLIVCCPQGFWRKGNIDIVCNRYGVRQAATLDDLVAQAIHSLKKAA